MLNLNDLLIRVTSVSICLCTLYVYMFGWIFTYYHDFTTTSPYIIIGDVRRKGTPRWFVVLSQPGDIISIPGMNVHCPEYLLLLIHAPCASHIALQSLQAPYPTGGNSNLCALEDSPPKWKTWVGMKNHKHETGETTDWQQIDRDYLAQGQNVFAFQFHCKSLSVSLLSYSLL